MKKKPGPKRRNTLTIDDDNAVRLERLRKTRDLSFKQIVNDVLRKGLAEEEKPFRRDGKPVEMPIFRGAKANFRNAAELKELMHEIQLEEDRRKLGLD
jgi:hypothetical protein